MYYIGIPGSRGPKGLSIKGEQGVEGKLIFQLI